ncbi:hypothetical protein SM124_18725 [Bacillus sp. 31A1R]|uniref:Uncharacterized protein n=1 Tax=Robertmurraya mangrovi TaxID=3098077 RepID=A0ABU5J318_9BACI|nr:hypothetical protein [Bacillus sp. 31A1R]MDZ5473756.1 hypothetical protein [Bacillus sp. 31A1R]
MTKRNRKTKSGLQSTPKSINDMELSKDVTPKTKKTEKTRPS